MNALAERKTFLSANGYECPKILTPKGAVTRGTPSQETRSAAVGAPCPAANPVHEQCVLDLG